MYHSVIALGFLDLLTAILHTIIISLFLMGNQTVIIISQNYKQEWKLQIYQIIVVWNGILNQQKEKI